MTTDLKGKAVLITGASTGIGAAAARAFARLGSRLIVHGNASRDAAEAVAADCRKEGAEAVVVFGDVCRAAEVKRIVAEAVAAFGRVDVLINNAGGMIGGRTRIEDYSEAYVQQVLALNCTSVAMFMHETLPLMRRQKSGNVINVTSIAGRIAEAPRATAIRRPAPADAAADGLRLLLDVEDAAVEAAFFDEVEMETDVPASDSLSPSENAAEPASACEAVEP